MTEPNTGQQRLWCWLKHLPRTPSPRKHQFGLKSILPLYAPGTSHTYPPAWRLMWPVATFRMR